MPAGTGAPLNRIRTECTNIRQLQKGFYFLQIKMVMKGSSSTTTWLLSAPFLA